MKRFVLSCCLLALTSTMVFAQAAKTTATKSKSTTAKSTAKPVKDAVVNDFIGKVNEFEAGISRNNTQLADKNFEDLKTIMTNDLRSLKPKIQNAANAAEKTKWTDIMNKKQAIYFDIINAASDKKGNKDLIVKKYKQYAATL